MKKRKKERKTLLFSPIAKSSERNNIFIQIVWLPLYMFEPDMEKPDAIWDFWNLFLSQARSRINRLLLLLKWESWRFSSIFLPDGMLYCLHICSLLWITSNLVSSKVKRKNKTYLPIYMVIKAGERGNISLPTSSYRSTWPNMAILSDSGKIWLLEI